MYDFNSKTTYTFRGFYIPPRMMYSIELYVKNHIAPGQFLQSVIKNDLFGACARADDENLENLPAYVGFFVNHTPISCHGSQEAFDAWIKQ